MLFMSIIKKAGYNTPILPLYMEDFAIVIGFILSAY